MKRISVLFTVIIAFVMVVLSAPMKAAKWYSGQCVRYLPTAAPRARAQAMAVNIKYKPGYERSVVVTDPAAPVSGDPIRYGLLTGIALTDEGEGGNDATHTSVDLGPFTAEFSVIDEVGGGIGLGEALFYDDALNGLTNDPSGNYFFGFAMATVGVGLTATIEVLHAPAPGSGTLGAGTIATANLAAGILAADVPGRAKMAAGYFDVATVLAKFAAGSLTTANLVSLLNADGITNAVLIQAILDGAFQNDAATRALFADEIWTEAKLTPASLTALVAKVVADKNVIGGIPVVFRIKTAGGATADTDVVSTHKIQILDFWTINAGLGTAGDTITLKTAVGTISDAVDINDADKTISRPATIDDAQNTVLAGGTIRVTETDGGGGDSPAVDVYVLAIRVS